MLAATQAEQVAPTLNLDIIRNRLKQRLSEMGVSGNEVSRRAGLGLSYVNDIIGGQSKNPAVGRLRKVAQVLECDVAWLTGEQDAVRIGRNATIHDFPSGRSVPDASSIPLYSTNLPDAEGYFQMLDEEADETVPPFDGVIGGYAVLVPDDAMAPRYRAGETVFVNPRKPIAVGAYVVLRFADNRALIREVSVVSPTSVSVKDLASGKATDFERASIKTIHRITATATN